MERVHSTGWRLNPQPTRYVNLWACWCLCLVPATAVVHVCPDCPTADNLNEPVVKETANLSLQRFNEESRLANYFTLENITRASSQVKKNICHSSFFEKHSGMLLE